MINFHTVPDNSKFGYFVTGNCFGPFAHDGKELFDLISFRSSIDYLSESPGIYGDNHVSHSELHADLYENPYHGVYPPKAYIQIFTQRPDGSPNMGSSTWCYAAQLAPAHDWLHVGNEQLYSKVSPSKIRSAKLNEVRNRNGAWQSASQYLSESVLLPPDAKGNRIQVTSYCYTRIPLDSRIIDTDSAYVDIARQAWRSFDEHRADFEDMRSNAYGWMIPALKRRESSFNARLATISLESLSELRYTSPKDVKSFGDLAVDAIKTLDTNSVNMFEFLQGFKKPWEMIPKLKNLSKLKTHAGNYLAVEYGVLPTISDLQKLWEAISSAAPQYYDINNYQVLTAGSTKSLSNGRGYVEMTRRLKIAVNQNDPSIFGLSERLRDLGAFPSVDNLWELVPFSFVLDWFINVGDMLETWDTRHRMASLPIVYATTSTRTVIRPTVPKVLMDYGYGGDLSINFYDRSVSTQAPSPTLNFEASNELPSHWLEATALIVANRK